MERRRSPRFRAKVWLALSIVGDNNISQIHAFSQDLSERGVCVCMNGAPIGAWSIPLEIQLPNSPNAILLTGDVRYRTDQYVGIEFVWQSEGQRKLIRSYCRWQPPKKGVRRDQNAVRNWKSWVREQFLNLWLVRRDHDSLSSLAGHCARS